jgi:diacylglycerol kinase (ATP)
MANRRVLIIANPTSGKGRGAQTAEVVHTFLCGRGIKSRIRYTTKAGDAERIAREACCHVKVDEANRAEHGHASADHATPDRPDRPINSDLPDTIVACGGDGTIQQVAAVLAELRAKGRKTVPAMGLAPAGRCNDFARVLGITREPEAIANVLAEGVRTPLDLGRVNDRYFCTIATLGIDAEVSDFVDTMRMPLRGTIAYLYGAIRMLFRYRAKTVRIEGDFGEIERAVFLASTGNTSSYGGAIPIVPEANPTDGLLDLCVIDRVSRIRAMLLIPVVMRGKHPGRRGITIVQSKKLRIVSDQAVELWADGERIGKTPVTIEAVPGAIDVLLSKNWQPG